MKNHVFHVKERIYNLQISLSELVSLSWSPAFALSATIRARLVGQNSLSATPSRVGIALSAPLLAQGNPLSGWNCA